MYHVFSGYVSYHGRKSGIPDHGGFWRLCPVGCNSTCFAVLLEASLPQTYTLKEFSSVRKINHHLFVKNETRWAGEDALNADLRSTNDILAIPLYVLCTQNNI